MTSLYLWLRTGSVSHAYTIASQTSLCGRAMKPTSRRFTRGGVLCGLCRHMIDKERRSGR